MNGQSYDLFSKEHEADQKFQYYFCTIAGALFAYVVQNYKPHKFDSVYFLLIPLAMLLLTVCFLFGLWLIHKSKIITKLNKEGVSYFEENQNIMTKLSETDKVTNRPYETFTNMFGTIDTRHTLMQLMQKNAAEAEKSNRSAKAEMNCADKIESVRNWTLAFGFLLIFVAKIVQPYI